MDEEEDVTDAERDAGMPAGGGGGGPVPLVRPISMSASSLAAVVIGSQRPDMLAALCTRRRSNQQKDPGVVSG